MTEEKGFWKRLFGDAQNRRRHEAYRRRDWSGVAEACRRILDKDPYHRKALHDLAVACARLGEHDDAYEACRRLCLLDSGRGPEDDPARQAADLLAKAEQGGLSFRYLQHLPHLAELLAMRGRQDLAAPLLESLLDLPDAFPRAASALALVRAQAGDLDGVEALLGRLRRGPVGLRDELLGRLEGLAAGRPSDLMLARVRARLLQDAGRLQVAEQDAQARLALDPTDRGSLALLAAARMAAGDPAAAVEHFRRWTNLWPDEEAGYRGLAMAGAATGDLRMQARALRGLARRFPERGAEALDMLRESVADPDTDPEVQGHLAALLLAEGELDRALEAYRKVAQAAPRDSTVHRQWDILAELALLRRIAEHRLALACADAKTDGEPPAKVLVHFQGRDIRLKPSGELGPLWSGTDPSRVRLNLARLLLDRQRQESLALLQRVVRESRAYRDPALYLLGVAFLEEGYREPAHRAFAAVDPALPGLAPAERVQVLHDLAVRAEEQGWLATAHKALAALLVLDMSYADARSRYERIQGLLAASPREREPRAQDLPPRDRVEALYKAGQDYEARGDTENALRAYEDVLMLDVDYADVRQRFDRLARIGTGEPAEDARFVDRMLLGRGGMGTVHKAYDKRLRREVALKEINERFRGDPAAVARFRREAHAAAALPPHPGLVQVYDIVEEGDLAIVLEFVPGESLRALLRRERALTEDRALRMALGMAAALDHAHRHGVVHRDVKPDNVLVLEGDRVKVTDFGLAHLDTATVLTTLGEVMGTSLYMPPEQIRGRAVDRRSDIYSLGITLYEMLTGNVPFAEGDVAFRHVFEEPESPLARNPGLRPATAALVLRCLAKDPAARYPDCEGLAHAVRKALGV